LKTPPLTRADCLRRHVTRQLAAVHSYGALSVITIGCTFVSLTPAGRLADYEKM